MNLKEKFNKIPKEIINLILFIITYFIYIALILYIPHNGGGVLRIFFPTLSTILFLFSAFTIIKLTIHKWTLKSIFVKIFSIITSLSVFVIAILQIINQYTYYLTCNEIYCSIGYGMAFLFLGWASIFIAIPWIIWFLIKTRFLTKEL